MSEQQDNKTPGAKGRTRKNPPPTDEELEALMARHGTREYARLPEVQAKLLKELTRRRNTRQRAESKASKTEDNT